MTLLDSDNRLRDRNYDDPSEEMYRFIFAREERSVGRFECRHCGKLLTNKFTEPKTASGRGARLPTKEAVKKAEKVA